MSIYSNVTEQNLTNLRKMTEEQKNQRALKTKIRVLKQTRDIQLAESLSPITKKLDEVKDSTQKMGDVVKENNAPQLAMETTQNKLPIENKRIHPGVINDTSLEKSLSNMEDQKGFFKKRSRT